MNRAKMAAKTCEHKAEMRELLAENLETVEKLEVRQIAELESMSQDRRDLIAELATGRDQATSGRQLVQRQYEEQQAATERLRNSRNGTQLERSAQLEEQVKALQTRRKANQRTMADYNLSERRVEVAQQQQAAAQRQLGEFAVRDLSTDMDLEHAHTIAADLAATRGELQAQAAECAAQATAQLETLNAKLKAATDEVPVY
jgi:hypothetical protein